MSNELVMTWLGEGEPKRSLLNSTKKLQLTYFGHVIRANGMEAELTLSRMEGKRRRGRQWMRWLDGVVNAAGEGLQ